MRELGARGGPHHLQQTGSHTVRQRAGRRPGCPFVLVHCPNSDWLDQRPMHLASLEHRSLQTCVGPGTHCDPSLLYVAGAGAAVSGRYGLRSFYSSWVDLYIDSTAVPSDPASQLAIFNMPPQQATRRKKNNALYKHSNSHTHTRLKSPLPPQNTAAKFRQARLFSISQ
jgi:hypothetical protein